jgi:hypothetical protein
VPSGAPDTFTGIYLYCLHPAALHEEFLNRSAGYVVGQPLNIVVCTVKPYSWYHKYYMVVQLLSKIMHGSTVGIKNIAWQYSCHHKYCIAVQLLSKILHGSTVAIINIA